MSIQMIARDTAHPVNQGLAVPAQRVNILGDNSSLAADDDGSGSTVSTHTQPPKSLRTLPGMVVCTSRPPLCTLWMRSLTPAIVRSVPQGLPARGQVCDLQNAWVQTGHRFKGDHPSIRHFWITAADELPTVVVLIVTRQQDRLDSLKNLSRCDGRTIARCVEWPRVHWIHAHSDPCNSVPVCSLARPSCETPKRRCRHIFRKFPSSLKPSSVRKLSGWN